MNRFSNLAITISAILFPTLALAQLPADLQSDLGPGVPPLKVRPGYRVTRALPDKFKPVEAIRFLQLSEDGKTLYISDREHGNIYALRDPDADGVYKTVTVFVKNKPSVQGMDVRDGWLYFSQAGEGSVSRAKDTNGDGVADEIQSVVPAGGLPKGGGHPFEGLLVTDKNIYVTSSDPQNMTPIPDDPNSDQPERKTIYVFDFDGKAASHKRVFCTGIRNTEKLRYRPGTTEIWGFDHGSDNFGKTFGETNGKRRNDLNQPITDLNPPEEFNLYVQDGFYGHPYITGNRVPRPEFASRKDIVDLAARTIVPEWCVHAHWAVLGWTFFEKDTVLGPKGDCVFASHGSWNSTKPVGVVQRLIFDPVTGKPCGSQTIVDCQGPDRRYARPVDCVEAPDGSIIFSSDEPPALYRISRSAAK